MYTFLIVIQIIALFLSVAGVVVIVWKKPGNNSSSLMLLFLTIFLQCLGYLGELTSGSLAEVLMSLKIQYTGSCYSLLLIMSFLLDYYEFKPHKGLIAIASAINSFILALIYTFDYNDLFYKTKVFKQDGLYPHIEISGSAVYYALRIEIVIIIIMILSVLAAGIKKRGRNKLKMQIPVICAMIIPSVIVITNVIGLFGIYDPTSVVSAVSGVFIIYAAARNRLFNIITPIHEDIIEIMKEALIIVDDRYRVVSINKSAASMFPELINSEGQHIGDCSLKLYEVMCENNMVEFSRNERHYEAHLSEKYSNGSLRGFYAWIFDVTDKHITMEKLVEMKSEAERANEAKSAFLANMSHEIRTPMNAVLGMAEMILREDISLSVREEAAGIMDAGQNLLSIINDILDISKIERGKLELVNEDYRLDKLLAGVISITEIKLKGKNIKLIPEYPDSMPMVLNGDKTRIRQILINLLGNAVKFTQEGEIGLRVICNCDEEYADLSFSVFDTGMGIKKENLDKIFNSFERLSSERIKYIEGTGLGLAICKQIVELMNGTISVQSVFGAGSTFVVRLRQKIVNSSSINIEKSEEKQDTFIMPDVKILVVDDNPVNLKVVKGLLRAYQSHVYLVSSGRECLEIIKLHNFDVILLDHMMPEMDGIETIHAIRSQSEYYKKSPVIALTANAVHGSREIFIREGFQDYVSKPIDTAELERVLVRWIPQEKLVCLKQ